MRLQSTIVCIVLAFTAAPYLVRGDKNAIDAPSPEEGTSLTDSPTPFDQMEAKDQSLVIPRTSASAFNWISPWAWYEYWTRSTQAITISKEEQFHKKKEELMSHFEVVISVYNAFIVGDEKAEKIFPIQAVQEVMESLRLRDRWTYTWDQFVSHCNDVMRQTSDKIIEIEFDRKGFRDTLVDVEMKMNELVLVTRKNVIKNYLFRPKARFDKLRSRFNEINKLSEGSIEDLKKARNLFDSFHHDWRNFEAAVKRSPHAAPPGLLDQPYENNVEINLKNNAESHEENHEENQEAAFNEVRATLPGSSSSSITSTMTYLYKIWVAIQNIIGYISMAQKTWQTMELLVCYGTFVMATFQSMSSGGGMPIGPHLRG